MSRVLAVITLSLALLGCVEQPSRVLTTTAAARPPLPHVADPAGFPESVRIDLAEDRGYLFAPVAINGQDAGMFMIDTGANITVVEAGVANRLGLPAVGDGRTLGVAGRESFRWRGIEMLTLGDRVALDERRAAALSLYRLADNLGAGVNGILGCRSFGPLPFTIDPASRTLTLHRRDAYRPDPAAQHVRLISFRGLPAIEATVGDPQRHHRVWLILDTGAYNDLTLPDDLPLQWPDILPVPQHGHGRTIGVGGSLTSRQAWVGRLDLMGVSLRDVETHFEAPPPDMRRTPVPVGRIGNGLLRHFRLSFDPQRSAVDAVFLPIASE